MNKYKILLYNIFAFLLFQFSSCKNTNSLERPNIVWITSEDNSVHYMKLYNEGGVKTPNIEKLANSGIIFNKAFSNTPVCSAARSTLISGVYGPKLGTHYHRNQKKIPMPNGLKMFPAYLKEAGYYTTNNSKEDYNIIKSDDVWDMSSKNATWKNRVKGQPFFHVYNIAVSHEGSLHFSEKDMSIKTPNFNIENVKVQPNHPNTDIFRYTNAIYRDRILSMDEKVGDIVKRLEEDGLLDNTFIFYFGDHGGVLPNSKGYLYDTGLHVPLVVHIPKKYKHLISKKISAKDNRFVSFIDFAPTVLSIANIEIPKQMDGKPFLIKWKEEEEDKKYIYNYADRFDEKYDMVRAIHKGKYKYIRSYQPFNYDGLMNRYRYKQLAYQEWFQLYKEGKLNKIQSAFFEPRRPEMLFDTGKDPYETNNLADITEYKNTLLEMRKILNDKEEKMPDLSFYPEYYLIKNAFDNPMEFGEKYKYEISNYIKVANLSLYKFEDIKLELKNNLESSDPWVRYWAIIQCSVFGEKAKEFISITKHIASNDRVLINRVRAAEFLGIIKVNNPKEIMTNALYKSNDETESLLILNSIALMSDIHYNYKFDIEKSKIKKEFLKVKMINHRLDYIESLSFEGL